MDLADDVAYSVHDLEDGVVAGKIDLARLDDPGERKALWDTVRDWYLPAAEDTELDEALGRLRLVAAWPEGRYDGSRRATAALKNLTSALIGSFCSSVRDATRDAYGSAPLARYAADLVVPPETVLAIGVLKGVAAHYVMRADDRVAILERQLEVLTELVAALVARGPDALQPAHRADFEQAGSDAARLRVIVDQVASLTDASALIWHARLAAAT
jgi:dGTPase